MTHDATIDWIKPTPAGLYVAPGDFYIDPTRAVDRAVITHGHSDHARPGHRKILATRETLAIMEARYGADLLSERQALAYGELMTVNGVSVRLAPAGHILGSAQVVLEYGGRRVVVSGDYKRRPDATCASFEPQPCDVFVTEATFGLPVFRHPPDGEEIGKLLHSLKLFPERSHLVGVYPLGKCQRVIMLLRAAGYDAPIYLHGGVVSLYDLYRSHGVALGDLRLVANAAKADLAGAVVLAPPSALADRWSRRLVDPVTAMASGWMRVKQRAKQQGVELPLVISDHADWDELTATIAEVDAPNVWVTHGREEALVHLCKQQGRDARALAVVGFEEEGS
ncbi:MAG: ligase-associated DNA damage response exonuclease [Proteobacteria bacterium]|nr:ligase-associated DNA damage response exonuclease [Pseudomonadota bacterium]